jgi:hypothetical protein
MSESTARTVTVSYPADLSDWGRDIVEGTPFRAYLRRAHDAAAVGDEWAEFVGVGCCGDSLDVPLRVEDVVIAGETDGEEGLESGRIVDSTTFAFEERAACGLAGGWAVQSESGG